MATSITAAIMLAALKRWGITPKFYRPDWQTHNRTAVQGWGPLYGFVVHNFASDISDENSLAYLYRGDAARDLPGPLSQFAITDDGQVWVIGWGTANHTGTVDPATHALVKRDAMPRDRDVRPTSSSGVKGGPGYIGVEMTYGAKGPTAKQRAACVRLAAAMAEMLGGTGGSVVGHRECTTTRSDPQAIAMGPFRREVDALIKAGPGRTGSSTPAAPAPAPAPITPPKETSNMALTTADASTILNADIIPSPDKEASNPFWTMASYFRESFRLVRAADQRSQVRDEAMLAAITALANAHGADGPAIAELVDKAVRDRLDRIELTVTDAPAS